MKLLRDLLSAKCVPCEGGEPPLSKELVEAYLKLVPSWKLSEDRHLVKGFKFKDFVAAMSFLVNVAELAESEGHHPDFSVHYNKVDFEVWTHAMNGLSGNDFILAAKIDELAE